MGRYRRSYSYDDTPQERTWRVAGVAGTWGAFGWFPCVLLTVLTGAAESTWLWLYGIGFVLVFIWGHRYIPGAAVQDQGTYTEMLLDPDLNTENPDLHWRRLKRYGRSRHGGEMVFMGPRGGIYTITASGNRNYR